MHRKEQIDSKGISLGEGMLCLKYLDVHALFSTTCFAGFLLLVFQIFRLLAPIAGAAD